MVTYEAESLLTPYVIITDTNAADISLGLVTIKNTPIFCWQFTMKINLNGKLCISNK